MEFVETKKFSKAIGQLISDEELGRLQLALSIRPDIGKIIPGTGGLRKLRWVRGSQGKRGGTRIIYYWYVSEVKIYLLLAHKKAQKDNLTKEELKILADLVKEEQ